MGFSLFGMGKKVKEAVSKESNHINPIRKTDNNTSGGTFSSQTVKLGQELLSNFDDVGTLGKHSNSLHFISLLTMKTKYTNSGRLRVAPSDIGAHKPNPNVVGVRLRTDITLNVPVIDVLKNKDTGIEPDDVGSRQINAGEEFIVNMYELMYLVTRKEYAGSFSFNSESDCVYFLPKLSDYESGRDKLPTPALYFRRGRIGDHEERIDIGNASEGKSLKPEYEESFGALLTPAERNPVRLPTSPLVWSLGLSDFLHGKLNGITQKESISVEKRGNEIWESLSEEARGHLGEMSNTLHYVSSLTHKPITSKEPVTVGVRLKTDVPISVPDIDSSKNSSTCITSEDIKSRSIGAGETFILNMYEFMFLLIKKEYGGYLSLDKNPSGAYLYVILNHFESGKHFLPKPSIRLKEDVIINESITELDSSGSHVLKEEHREKFSSIVRGRKAPKDSHFAPTPAAVALALERILNNRNK